MSCAPAWMQNPKNNVPFPVRVVNPISYPDKSYDLLRKSMLIAISIETDNGLDSHISPVFGRSPYFIFVNTENKAFHVEENPAKFSPGGAGVQAAQLMLDKQVNAVVCSNLGPKASAVFDSAGIACFQHRDGSVNDILDLFLNNELNPLTDASVGTHTGIKP